MGGGGVIRQRGGEGGVKGKERVWGGGSCGGVCGGCRRG